MSNKSPKTVVTSKEKAWAAFSEYVRVKECLESTGLAFVGVCFTCQRRFHISMLDAGHCFGGRRNARLFDIMCVRAQCRTWCNRMRHGEPEKFKKRLAEIYGEEWVENRRIRGLRVIKDNQIDWAKLQKGVERMRNTLFRKYGFKTFGEILRESENLRG